MPLQASQGDAAWFHLGISEFQGKSKEQLSEGRFKAKPAYSPLHVLTLGFSVSLSCAVSRLTGSHFVLKHKSHRLRFEDDCFRKEEGAESYQAVFHGSPSRNLLP